MLSVTDLASYNVPSLSCTIVLNSEHLSERRAKFFYQSLQKTAAYKSPVHKNANSQRCADCEDLVQKNYAVS